MPANLAQPSNGECRGRGHPPSQIVQRSSGLGTALVLIATAGLAVETYQKLFTAKTGLRVVAVDSDNPALPIKAHVEAGYLTVDVLDIG